MNQADRTANFKAAQKQFCDDANNPIFLKNFFNSEKIKNFLDYDIDEEGTRKGYKIALKHFIYQQEIKNIDGYFVNPETLENGAKLAYKDELELKLKKHKTFLLELGYGGANIKARLSAICSFLEHNKIDLGSRFWKDAKKKLSTDRVTDSKTPDKKMLREIIGSGDLEAQTAFLIQMNTGARIDQIITLRWSNIQNLDNEFPMLVYRPEENKTKKLIKTFITPETKELLLRYKTQQQQFINTRLKRGKNFRQCTYDDDLIFPMSMSNIQKKWRTMLKNSSYYRADILTGKQAYSTHCLRRYFLDNFGDRELAEFFCGKASKLKEAYFRKPDDELRRIYAEHANNLFVLKDTSENTIIVKGLQQDLETQKQKNNIMEEKYMGESRIRSVQEKQLKERIDKLEKIITVLINDSTLPAPTPTELKQNIYDKKTLEEIENREDKAIRQRKHELEELISNNPKYKNTEIIMFEGAPFLQKKDRKKTVEEITFHDELKKLTEARLEQERLNKKMEQALKKINKKV